MSLSAASPDVVWIFIPALGLGFWTLLVLLLLPVCRFAAIRRGQVQINDFKLQESNRVPELVVKVNRNYMNLLELPVLFYFVCVLFFLFQAVTELTLVLAWLYLGLRVLHSVIHLTYNRVFHRFLIFAASNLVLLLLWLTAAATILTELQA